jgi:tetratricopeptide (TPR) repeat protein
MYEHFKQQVLDKHALSVNHAGKEGKRLLQSCERLKKLLSTIGEASVSVENIVPDRDYTLQLTRDVFESLCAPDAQRVHELLTQVLADAQLSSDQVASVEIVGGGTRIPFVQQAILRAFPGRDASLIGRMLDSTTSVAVGAAFSAPLAISEELSSLFTDEEARLIDALVAQEAEMQDRDTDLAAIAHERNAIEAFVYEMRSKAETKHSDKISFAALNPLLDAAEDWIYSEESELATLELIRNKHKQIRQEIQSVCSDYFRAIDADERALEAQLEDESRRAEAEREADGGGDDHDTRKLKKPERMRLVAKNKDEGNELFRDGNFQHAAMRYVKALSHAAKFFDLTAADQVEVDKLKLSLYLNLAQCYLKLEQWPKAIANCRDALALDAKNPKALYRRALAFEKEKKLDEAMQDVKAALAVAPEDKAILKLDERLKVLRKREVDKEKKMWSKAFQ